MLEKRDRYKIVEKRTGKVIKKFRLKNAMLAYWESLYMQELYEIVDSQPDSLRTKGGSNNEKG